MRLSPGLSALAVRKVRPTTQKLYVAVLEILVGWLCMVFLPDWPGEVWDEALENFVEWMYDRGYPFATAMRVPAALLWVKPALHTAAQLRILPRVSHCLAGWRQLHPPGSRPPIPWVVVAAIAEFLQSHSKVIIFHAL